MSFASSTAPLFHSVTPHLVPIPRQRPAPQSDSFAPGPKRSKHFHPTPPQELSTPVVVSGWSAVTSSPENDASSASSETLAPPPAAAASSHLLPTPESTPPSDSSSGSESDSSVSGSESADKPPSENVPRPRNATSGVSPKDRFVAGLVGASVIAIESIWGSPADSTDSGVLPLQWFVKEVLRRSRTSCSTLQVALYYLHKARRDIRAVVAQADVGARRRHNFDANHLASYPSPPLTPVESLDDQLEQLAQIQAQASPVLCGRRMFLAALIAASKYLQDKNFSNRAWAKISGLPSKEVTDNERIFLELLDYRLHLASEDFDRWTERLASLASQGVVLEVVAASASSSSSSSHGLARSATEYPPIASESLRDIATAPAPIASSQRVPVRGVARTYTDPEVSQQGTPSSFLRAANAASVNRAASTAGRFRPTIVTERKVLPMPTRRERPSEAATTRMEVAAH